MAFGDEDVAAAFRGPGTVPVFFGAVSTRGFLDVETADVLDAGGAFQTQVRRTTLLVMTDSLPGLVVDNVIEIGDEDSDERTEYQVRGLNPLDDEATTELVVVKV